MKQTRHIKAETDAITTNQNLTLEMIAERTYNAHGLRVEINIESEAMEANANGFWGVYMFPGDVINIGDLPGTWIDFDNEDVSQYLWGTGTWMASNQTPDKIVFEPKTSRNMQKNSRIFV